jgi:hypothetical protein
VAKWTEQPRTVLEHLIRDSGRTYEDLTDEFVAIGDRLGLSASLTPRHLRRLAAGERSGSRLATKKVFEELFGHPAEFLFQPWGADVQAQLVGESDSSEPAGATLTQEEILDMTTRRARQFAMLSGQYIAAEAIEQLHDDVRHIATSYPQQPLAAVLGDLASTQEAVFTVLEQRHRPAESKQLHLLGGVIGGVLAKASHDMGDSHAAMTHARTGFLCAEHADHDGLRAWIRGLQSLVSYWAKRPHESLRYAEQGSLFAGRSGSTTSVWLPVNEARAWAALGNATKARAAIERAEAAWDTAEFDDLDLLGGMCTFGRSRQLYYAADALALLPDQADEAERYSLQALDAYADVTAADWSFSDQAGSFADLAVARITKGEIEGAADAIGPVLDLPAEQRINGIVASAQRVHAALAKSSDSTAATDLQLEIEAFTRMPLAALPR